MSNRDSTRSELIAHSSTNTGDETIFLFNTDEHRRQFASAVFAIKQIFHGLAASCVRPFVALPPVPGLRSGFGSFILTARRTPVGEAWLSGLQVELFTANRADFNRKGHNYRVDFSSSSVAVVV